VNPSAWLASPVAPPLIALSSLRVVQFAHDAGVWQGVTMPSKRLW
jgi:hypothetical protein